MIETGWGVGDAIPMPGGASSAGVAGGLARDAERCVPACARLFQATQVTTSSPSPRRHASREAHAPATSLLTAASKRTAFLATTRTIAGTETASVMRWGRGEACGACLRRQPCSCRTKRRCRVLWPPCGNREGPVPSAQPCGLTDEETGLRTACFARTASNSQSLRSLCLFLAAALPADAVCGARHSDNGKLRRVWHFVHGVEHGGLAPSSHSIQVRVLCRGMCMQGRAGTTQGAWLKPGAMQGAPGRCKADCCSPTPPSNSGPSKSARL